MQNLLYDHMALLRQQPHEPRGTPSKVRKKVRNKQDTVVSDDKAAADRSVAMGIACPSPDRPGLLE